MSLNLPAPGLIYNRENEALARTSLEREDLRNLKSGPRTLWTPSLGGSATYNDRKGSFTETNGIIEFDCNLDVLLIGTGSATLISGLPKPSSSYGVKSAVVGYFGGIATSVTWLGAYINASSATIGFSCLTAAAASVTNLPNIFQNGTVLFVSGRYAVDIP